MPDLSVSKQHRLQAETLKILRDQLIADKSRVHRTTVNTTFLLAYDVGIDNAIYHTNKLIEAALNSALDALDTSPVV